MPGGIHPPLDVVLSWPLPNYVDPVRRGWGIVILIIILFVLTAIAVSARLWARLVIQSSAGVDDAIIVACMIPTLGLAVSIILGSRLYGFDRHVWDLTPERAVDSRKATLAISSFYIASTSMTKVSILLFYRRMASGSVSPLFHFAVRAAIASVVAYGITFQLTLYFGCHPLNAFWNQVDFNWVATHTEGVNYHCFSETGSILSSTAISIVQDFITCGMPTILFWKLQLPIRQKIALGALFGVGFFMCITGVLRIVYIYHVYYQTYDVTWAAQGAWAWTGVEAHIAIICSSAPALKVFFNQYLDVTKVTGVLKYSLSRSWHSSGRQDDGTGRSQDTKTGLSAMTTDSLSKSQSTHVDIELGGIGAIPKADIASVYGERPPSISDRVSSNSSQRPLR